MKPSFARTLAHLFSISNRSAGMKKSRPTHRCFRIEPLEQRQMLSALPVFDLIGPMNGAGDTLTIGGGAPVHYGIDGGFADGSGGAIDYDVIVKNVDGSTNTDITAQILTGNRSIRITVEDVNGDGIDEVMILELFDGRVPETTAQFVELIEANFYNSDDQTYDMIFHRVINGFMIQTGDPTGTGSGGSGPGGTKGVEFDDQFNTDILHIGQGVIASAKSNDDTNDSQFFITDADTRHLDAQHSAFGQMTEGAAAQDLISAVTAPGSTPTTPVVIKSIEVIADDTENATLFLSAPEGMNIPTGLSIVITATDAADAGNANPVIYSLEVTPDTLDGLPFIDNDQFGDAAGDANAIRVTSGDSVTFQIPAINADGGTVNYGTWDAHTWNTGLDAEFDIDYDPATGQVTLTPRQGIVGNRGILIGTTNVDAAAVDFTVSDHPNLWGVDLGQEIFDWALLNYGYTQNALQNYTATWDFQFIPVFVKPAAPSSVELSPSSDTGASNSDLITRFNNSTEYLEFTVEGVTPGNLVTLYIDGVARGHQNVGAGETSVIVRTDQLTSIPDGAHAITVQQTANASGAATEVGNLTLNTTIVSSLSDPLTVTIDATSPVIDSTAPPAAEELIEYVYDVTVENDEPSTYELIDDSTYDIPDGMTIDPATGQIVWTPTHAQNGSNQIAVRATDLAGNSTTQVFTVDVNIGPDFDPIDSQQVDEGDPLVVPIVALDGATPVEPYFEGTVPGGMEIVYNSGAGTWELRWTPAEDQGPETYHIPIYAQSAFGVHSSTTVHITVDEVNTPPTFGPLGDVTVDEGVPLVIDMSTEAEDTDLNADGSPQTLTYALVGTPPAGMTIDPTTGVLDFTPNELQGGENFVVTVSVTDPYQATVEATLVVTVDETDTAPQFIVVPSPTVVTGNRLSTLVAATDPDVPTNTVRYRLESGAPAGMTIDQITGRILWTVPSDYGEAEIGVEVRAVEILPDGSEGLDVTTTVQITVVELASLIIPNNETTFTRRFGPAENWFFGPRTDGFGFLPPVPPIVQPDFGPIDSHLNIGLSPLDLMGGTNSLGGFRTGGTPRSGNVESGQSDTDRTDDDRFDSTRPNKPTLWWIEDNEEAGLRTGPQSWGDFPDPRMSIFEFYGHPDDESFDRATDLVMAALADSADDSIAPIADSTPVQPAADDAKGSSA